MYGMLTYVIKKGNLFKRATMKDTLNIMNESGEMGFQMVKDEDGIWNVSFTPIQ
jgi:hypothetical protein